MSAKRVVLTSGREIKPACAGRQLIQDETVMPVIISAPELYECFERNLDGSARFYFTAHVDLYLFQVPAITAQTTCDPEK